MHENTAMGAGIGSAARSLRVAGRLGGAVVLVAFLSSGAVVARDRCSRAATRTEIVTQLDHIRSLLASGDTDSSRRYAQRLEEMLACTEVPVVGQWLARLFFLEAVGAWEAGNREEARGLLADVVGASRMFEWDAALVPPRDHPEFYAAYRNAKATVLVRASPAHFVVVRGDRYGLVYVDGQGYAVSSAKEHLVRPGRHIVQFQLGDNRFAGEIRNFPSAPPVVYLEAPTDLLPGERSLEVAGAFLLFPSPVLAPSQAGAGLDLSVSFVKAHWRTRGFVAAYPVRWASPAGAEWEAGTTESLDSRVVRVGGVLLRRLGGDPGAARVVPAFGVAAGGLLGPYAVTWYAPGDTASSRMVLAPLGGGFLTSCLEARAEFQAFTVTAGAEAGYAVLWPVQRSLPGGDTLDSGMVGTVLAAVKVVAGWTF